MLNQALSTPPLEIIFNKLVYCGFRSATEY